MWSTITLPWTATGTAVGLCGVPAVVSAVAPAAMSVRRRAVEPAGVRE